jgi:hypothetical protein
MPSDDRLLAHWQLPGWQLADQRGLVSEHGPPPGRTPPVLARACGAGQARR